MTKFKSMITLTLLVLVFILISCTRGNGQPMYQEPPKRDTTIIDRCIISLNKRNFSDDIETLRDEVKETTDKARDSIQKTIPEVKRLMRSFGDYLKR